MKLMNYYNSKKSIKGDMPTTWIDIFKEITIFNIIKMGK